MRAVVDDRPLLQLNGGRPDRIVRCSRWALGCIARRGGRRAHRPGADPRADHAHAARRQRLRRGRGRSAAQPAAHLPRRAHPRPRRVVRSSTIPRPASIGSFQLSNLPLACVADRAAGRRSCSSPRTGCGRPGSHRSREHWRHAHHALARPRRRRRGPRRVAGIALLLQPADRLTSWSTASSSPLVALSLVPLTGYAGQISLAQITFAGIGGGRHAPWSGPTGSRSARSSRSRVTAVVGAPRRPAGAPPPGHLPGARHRRVRHPHVPAGVHSSRRSCPATTGRCRR